MQSTTTLRPIPLWLKIVFTAFILTLVGIWTESALLISMCCVGILLPQVLWCVDFIVVLCGGKLTGMTNYMVSDSPLFLRSLSLFHGWLPFLLFFLVRRTGFDRRALVSWTLLAWVLCLICYFLLPQPYVAHPGDLTPKNVNFVFGLDENAAQTWMPAPAFLITWMAALTFIVYVPTHLLLRRFIPAAKTIA